MNRDSSPEIEIVNEIIKESLPIVQVIRLPPAAKPQPPPQQTFTTDRPPPTLTRIPAAPSNNGTANQMKIVNIRTLVASATTAAPPLRQMAPPPVQGIKVINNYRAAFDQKSAAPFTVHFNKNGSPNTIYARYPDSAAKSVEAAKKPVSSMKEVLIAAGASINVGRTQIKRKNLGKSRRESAAVLKEDSPPRPLPSPPQSPQQRKKFCSTPISKRDVVVDDRNAANSCSSFPFYVYGRSNGFATAAEETANPFLCELCDRALSNNVTMMWHGFSHFVNRELNEDEDLCHISACSKCSRVFADPYRLMDHVQKVHKKESEFSQSVCYMCEMDFSTNAGLVDHLANVHLNTPDMPYICPVCRFQSSLYDDVVEHFAEAHKGTMLIMCPLCLQVIRTSHETQLARRGNVVNTILFATHIRAHIDQEFRFRCHSGCKLVFASGSDLCKHRTSSHAIRSNNAYLVPHREEAIAFDSFRPLTLREQTGRKVRRGRRLVRKGVDTDEMVAKFRCVECRRLLTDEGHMLRDSKHCSLCKFATCCVTSFQSHMTQHAKFGPRSISDVVFKRLEPVCSDELVCDCGFETKLGNNMAKHLTKCSIGLRTATLAPCDDAYKTHEYIEPELCSALGLVSDDRDSIWNRNFGEPLDLEQVEPSASNAKMEHAQEAASDDVNNGGEMVVEGEESENDGDHEKPKQRGRPQVALSRKNTRSKFFLYRNQNRCTKAAKLMRNAEAIWEERMQRHSINPTMETLQRAIESVLVLEDDSSAKVEDEQSVEVDNGQRSDYDEDSMSSVVSCTSLSSDIVGAVNNNINEMNIFDKFFIADLEKVTQH